jgi:hypothetical protein
MNRLWRAEPVAQQALQQMCEEAGGAVNAQFGGRIWLLPLWYLIAVHEKKHIRLAYAEVSLRLFHQPTMVELAIVVGPVPGKSEFEWALKKGFPGRLTFEDVDFDWIQYAQFWPANLNTMSEREWDALDESKTAGRSLFEARRLRELYGTAIGVPLKDPDSRAKLGCITLHTGRDRPLTEAEAEDIVALMLTGAPDLARQLVRFARLHLS